jgi:uncharacterized protein YdbL (DUF1318 family)
MKSIFFDPTGRGSDGQGQVCLHDADRAKPGVWPLIIFALLMGMVSLASAQTRIDLRTQAKSVDFSAAGSTKPSKTGTTIPATCSVGETFLKTDATAGQNLYVCTATNVWTLQGSAIPSVIGFANTVLATDGTALIWKALGGDASGTPGALTVAKIQGRPVSSAIPASGQALIWNSSTLQWEPTTIGFGQVSGTIGDGQVAAGINAAKIGGGAVSNSVFGYLANVTSDLQTQFNGKAATSHTHTVAGDASGALGAMTVTGLQGRAVASTLPSNGQTLVWNSAMSQWQPQNQASGVSGVFGRTGVVTAQTGDYSFSQISGTVADSQVAAGVSATKIGAGTVSNTILGYLANVTGDVQAQLNGKASNTQALAGDAGGTLGATTVMGLRNRAVAATVPANGQALVWNSATSQWEPQNQAGGVPSVFGRAGAVTSQMGDYSFSQILGNVSDSQVATGINAAKIGSGTVSNTTLGYLANVTSDLQAQLNGKAATSHTHATSGDVTGSLATTVVTGLQGRVVSPAAPSNGQALVWNSSLSQWQPQSQAGGVSTVFGRTGAVTSQTGDYSFSQISGTVTDSQISTGINANRIGTGTVGNSAFGYLGNVTSDIQAQLNTKASMSQAAGGDLSGSLGAPTVSAIQNRAVSAATPTDGQALVWKASAGQWQPQAVAGGVSTVFGRTGAISAQPGDYSFSQLSGTVMDSQVASGINAGKIGAGTVGNAAFSYLANVTSDIQSQLNARASTATALSGDLSGSLAYATVSGLQSRAVAGTAPSNGQVLTWNQNSTRWEPQSPAGITGGNFATSFASQTTVTVSGTTHQLGTANLLVGCYDTTASPNMRVQPNSVSVNPATYDVVVTFATAQTGRCVIAAGGGGGTGGGGGGASMASQLGDLNMTWTSATVLTVGSNCSTTTPCNARVGTNVYRFIHPSTITLTGGSGVAYLYVDPSGTLTVGHNLALTCTSPCSAVSGITGFPLNSLPLFSWSASGGTWDQSGGFDKRAVLSNKIVIGGQGIVTLDNGSTTSVAVDSSVVPQFLTATASLSFGPISTGSCAVSQTFTITGAVIGDSVAPGWPYAIEAGLLGIMWVSAPNTISVRMCNFSGATLTPAIASYRGTVVKSF